MQLITMLIISIYCNLWDYAMQNGHLSHKWCEY